MTTAATVQRSECAELFDARDRAQRRGEYSPIGKVQTIFTEAGSMQFRGQGPVLIELEDGSIDMLGTWPGLPDILEATDQLCNSCRAKCDECVHGLRVCPGVGCGGNGKVLAGSKPCPAAGCLEKTGKFKADCKKCGGRGELDRKINCRMCKGTGKAKCALCRGTGRQSTGRKNGSRDRLAAFCQDCEGQGRKLKRRPQAWQKFAHGTMQGYLVLGPITAIVYQTVGGDVTLRACRIVPDADQNYAVLLIERPQPGAKMHLKGGIPQLRR